MRSAYLRAFTVPSQPPTWKLTGARWGWSTRALWCILGGGRVTRPLSPVLAIVQELTHQPEHRLHAAEPYEMLAFNLFLALSRSLMKMTMFYDG